MQTAGRQALQVPLPLTVLKGDTQKEIARLPSSSPWWKEQPPQVMCVFAYMNSGNPEPHDSPWIFWDSQSRGSQGG